MKRIHMAVLSLAVLGILSLVTVARGIGGGVTAAEDDRFRINGTTLTKYLGTDTYVNSRSRSLSPRYPTMHLRTVRHSQA